MQDTPETVIIYRAAGCGCTFCKHAVQELEEKRYEQLCEAAKPRAASELPRGFQRGIGYLPSPESEAADFIHTDYVARYLQSRTPLYHSVSPCTANVCARPCRIWVAGLVQELLGKDVAAVVGEYLRGTGWPGAFLPGRLRALHIDESILFFHR